MKNKIKYLDIKLYPNKSIELKGLLFVGFIFAVLTTSISTHFIFHGAWPVGVFLFLDLMKE